MARVRSRAYTKRKKEKEKGNNGKSTKDENAQTNRPFTILLQFALFRRPINVMDRFVRYSCSRPCWITFNPLHRRARRSDVSKRHLGMLRSVSPRSMKLCERGSSNYSARIRWVMDEGLSHRRSWEQCSFRMLPVASSTNYSH